MGASDRDYFRDEEKRYSRVQSAWPAVTPVTKWLIIANIAVFLIDFFSRPGQQRPDFGVLNAPLCFSIESAFLEFRVWELLSFQFLHANPWHLLGNCAGLFIFGRWAENWWGSRRFLIFYLLCGVAGALFFTLLTLSGLLPFRNLDSPLVGASAGVYGILVSVAVFNPKEMVRLLLPPVDLTMRKLALIVLGVAAAIILIDNLAGGRPALNSGGEAGHLGGALLGFLLTRRPALLRHRQDRKIIRPPEFRRRRQKPKLRPRSMAAVDSASEVDRILDKISREGVQSLSKAERETLQRAGNTPKDR
jgi:membrane associated rhomboid family serine protease